MTNPSAIESSRLALLRGLDVLDSGTEPAFDALVRAASLACRCPVSLISLIDADRQWFKASVGLTARETPRNQAFCAHAIETHALFEVPDATVDPRFAGNPLVLGDPNIRFYAGQPIVYDGVALGTICVIDRAPRTLTADQKLILQDLAVAAVALLRGRFAVIETEARDRALAASNEALRSSERRLRAIADNLPALVCHVGLDNRYRFANAAYRTWFGFDPLGMVGRSVDEFFDGTTCAEMQPFVDRARKGERITFERRTLLAGKEHHFLVEYVPDVDQDGATQGIYAMTTDVTSRRQAELLLAASERRLRDVTNNIPAVIGQFDMAERCVFANDVGLRVHGLTRADVDGLTFGSHIPADLYDQHAAALREVKAGRRSVVHGQRTIDGKPCWFKAHLIPDRDEEETQRGFFVMTFDVTTLKAAEQARVASEQRLRDITDNLPVLISHIDRDERFTYVNETFRSWLGTEASALLGHTVMEAIGHDLYQQRRAQMDRCLHGDRVTFEIESTFQGEAKFLQTTYVPDIGQDGVVQGMTTLSVDVTELKRAEHRLSLLAHFDNLTGLPNRLQFNQQLASTLGMPGQAGRTAALMFLDVDHFKRINDTHGHAIGDGVLQNFATRLKRSVRSTDFVARLAGDEFVVILRNIAGIAEAEAIARKVVARVGRPFAVDGVLLTVTTSVGIGMCDQAGDDPARLLAKADKALYLAKEAGRNTFRLAA